jgi:Uma2 family endonuclease
MQNALKQIYYREDYLAFEEQSDIKHEFFRGEIFAMAGGSFNHAKISSNIVIELGQKLRGKSCTPMGSDMRIHTPSGLDTYPDVSIFCGKPELQDNKRTLLNPIVIFEVLSPSTRSYDRGSKFTLYRSIPSLQDYILVDSETILIEHYRRAHNNEWILHEYRNITENIYITAIEDSLSLNAIYEQIDFSNN